MLRAANAKVRPKFSRERASEKQTHTGETHWDFRLLLIRMLKSVSGGVLASDDEICAPMPGLAMPFLREASVTKRL